MAKQLENFYGGMSGLILPVPNKLHYPEEFQDKSRLCYYASLMNTIEINSSFYKVPLANTVKKWTNEVTKDFKFTFKLFKEITHSKNLDFNPELVVHFFKVIAEVGDKKGCLLVQLPPSVQIKHLPQIQFLVKTLRENDPQKEWNIALEFRHPSLYISPLYNLLETHQLGLVIHDKRPANTPMHQQNLPFIYLRFHGPNGNYRDSYEDDVLSEYASYVSDWLDDGKQVFSYFNNTMGTSYANLKTLREFIRY